MKKLLSVVCAFVILTCIALNGMAMADNSLDAVWVEGMYRSNTEADSDMAETDKDTQIMALNEELAAKNAQIEALNTIVEEKNAQIEGLNAVIADKDMQIDTLTAALEEKPTDTATNDLSDMSYVMMCVGTC